MEVHRDCGGGCNGQGVMVRRDMVVTEVVEEDAMDRVQWTGCHGDRGCGGRCNGQDVVVRRDMEVTEIVEDATDRVSWWRDMEVTEVVEEDAMDRMSW